MKKIFYIMMTVLLAAGCSFLDFNEASSSYSRESMYMTYSNIHKMLTNVYGYMPGKDIADVGSALRDCGSDDAEYANIDSDVQLFTNGNWSPVQTVDTKWDLYKGIRAANEFLESIQHYDISLYQHDASYGKWLKNLDLFPYEVRVLRANYIFELARRYGDIAMPVDVMLTAEEANQVKKTSFDDAIAFIASECSACAEHLPDSYVDIQYDNEFGRVTRGFALAVKAKALLYAASPLHNPSGDRSKWLEAAKAAKEIIDLGVYRLDPAEKANNYGSPEVIMCIQRSESSSFEKNNFPLRFTEGERSSIGGNFPTQNLVDAFQTVNGYDIVLTADGWQTDDPLFDITKPYENRDPRFARAILANGMPFKESTIETFVGGKDYAETRSDRNSITGYYLRKYVQEQTSFSPENQYSMKHQWVVYRYAEALLSYAEAANEYFQDPARTDDVLTLSALDAINQVRANAEMPDVTASNYQSFQDAVRREWRVEFAFEDHRFWDVRRWNIGATQGNAEGVEIVKNGSSYTYTRTTVRTRTWSPKMNLYPIPQTEVFANPGNLTQNTGW